MVIYSVFDFITIIGDVTCQSPILCMTFRVYEIVFGIVLVFSFCDLKFIKENFMFIKTVTGKGIFNMFLASMFLVGSDGGVWGWIMMGAFMICGLFFVIIGCCASEAYDDSDIDSKSLVNKVAKKGAKTAYENQDLLSGE